MPEPKYNGRYTPVNIAAGQLAAAKFAKGAFDSFKSAADNEISGNTDEALLRLKGLGNLDSFDDDSNAILEGVIPGNIDLKRFGEAQKAQRLGLQNDVTFANGLTTFENSKIAFQDKRNKQSTDLANQFRTGDRADANLIIAQNNEKRLKQASDSQILTDQLKRKQINAQLDQAAADAQSGNIINNFENEVQGVVAGTNEQYSIIEQQLRDGIEAQDFNQIGVDDPIAAQEAALKQALSGLNRNDIARNVFNNNPVDAEGNVNPISTRGAQLLNKDNFRGLIRGDLSKGKVSRAEADAALLSRGTDIKTEDLSPAEARLRTAATLRAKQVREDSVAKVTQANKVIIEKIKAKGKGNTKGYTSLGSAFTGLGKSSNVDVEQVLDVDQRITAEWDTLEFREYGFVAPATPAQRAEALKRVTASGNSKGGELFNLDLGSDDYLRTLADVMRTTAVNRPEANNTLLQVAGAKTNQQRAKADKAESDLKSLQNKYNVGSGQGADAPTIKKLQEERRSKRIKVNKARSIYKEAFNAARAKDGKGIREFIKPEDIGRKTDYKYGGVGSEFTFRVEREEKDYQEKTDELLLEAYIKQQVK